MIEDDHPLKNVTGTVVRACIAGIGPWSQSGDGTFWNIPEAWIRMDEELPKNLRTFSDERRFNIKLRADQVMSATRK